MLYFNGILLRGHWVTESCFVNVWKIKQEDRKLKNLNLKWEPEDRSPKIEDRISKVENRRSRNENRTTYIEDKKSNVEDWKLKNEQVEYQKSKVNDSINKIKNSKFLLRRHTGIHYTRSINSVLKSLCMMQKKWILQTHWVEIN